MRRIVPLEGGIPFVPFVCSAVEVGASSVRGSECPFVRPFVAIAKGGHVLII